MWRLRCGGGGLSFTGPGSGPLLHFVGSVQLVFPDDGQRVGLSVEDPVVEGEVVVIGEEQVEIPAGDTHISEWPVQQPSWENNIPASPSHSPPGSIWPPRLAASGAEAQSS